MCLKTERSILCHEAVVNKCEYAALCFRFAIDLELSKCYDVRNIQWRQGRGLLILARCTVLHRSSLVTMIRVMNHSSIPLLDAVSLMTIVTSSINDACSFMPLLCCHAMEPVARVMDGLKY
jgi:hypothetical protein